MDRQPESVGTAALRGCATDSETVFMAVGSGAD